MVSNLDDYRSGWLIIRRHGDDAIIHAAIRAAQLLERSDLDGQRAWPRILDAIRELQSKEVPDGKTRH